MKLKTIQNNIIIIIFSLFFLESCKNLPGADARKVSYDPKKRVQKNIEEGRGFRIMGGNKKIQVNLISLVQMNFGELL